MTLKDWIWLGATILALAVGAVSGFYASVFQVRTELLEVSERLTSIEIRLEATAQTVLGRALGPVVPDGPANEEE